MKKTRLNWFLLVLTFFVLAACAPPGILYLNPGKYLEPVVSSRENAQIVLEKFSESFSSEEFLGRHLIGKRPQLLRVRSGLVSNTVDTLLGDMLLNENVSFKKNSGWDRGLVGLRDYNGQARIVIGGEITQFSVQVKTDLSRITSTLNISMDVDCLVGFVDEGEIVRKTVHMSKKVLRFSANQKAMEKVVDAFLADVVQQVYKNIEEFVK